MGAFEYRFPFRTSLSLEGLVDFWADLRDRPDSPWSAHAHEVLRRLESVPELRGARIDPATAARHRDLVRDLLAVLFPVGEEGVLGLAGEPFRFDSVYVTPDAERLGVFGQNALFTETRYEPELMLRGQMMAAYEQVLQFLYDIDVNFDPPVVVTVEDPGTGLERHFQLAWDAQFMRVTAAEGTRRAEPEEIEELLAEPMDLERWARVLPPERFELGGLSITRALDVTLSEASSLLKEALLSKDAMVSGARLRQLEVQMRTLLGEPDVEIGLIGFDREASVEALDRAVAVGKSLLIRRDGVPECPECRESTYAQVFGTQAPVVFRDLSACGCDTGFERSLLENGTRSLALLPLSVDDRLVGLLEVGSPRARALNMYRVLRLKAITPAFATALQRSMGEREDRLQSIIKQRYTAIHPSVEWRFRRAAARLMEGAGDDHPVMDEIVFRDVYPLYGLTDIRGSSDMRSAAIQDDLAAQIELARALVSEAERHRTLPALGEIAYRLGRLEGMIRDGLLSEDEGQVLDFLGSEVEPLMDRLGGFGESVRERVEAYRAALDPELGVVYRKRRDFEASVARFNEAVCAVLDREQAVVQAVFPHFFERFKTDGVDYNVYVGESLAEKGGFSRLYLHNLRIWQLQLAGRVEWELKRIRPELLTGLPATHLILVQDHPLSIRFRVDEKRFDVDGAYNIRYALVKKRIDKARVRGTGERLTQPGTVAVVYSQPHEGTEYRRYLDYLTEEGYFEGGIEALDLEEMQGVLGLKALRVAIGKKVEPTEQARRPALSRVEEILAG